MEECMVPWPRLSSLKDKKIASTIFCSDHFDFKGAVSTTN